MTRSSIVSSTCTPSPCRRSPHTLANSRKQAQRDTHKAPTRPPAHRTPRNSGGRLARWHASSWPAGLTPKRAPSSYNREYACAVALLPHTPSTRHRARRSQVPQHAELCWILSCGAPFNLLNTMTQFKVPVPAPLRSLRSAGLHVTGRVSAGQVQRGSKRGAPWTFCVPCSHDGRHSSLRVG